MRREAVKPNCSTTKPLSTDHPFSCTGSCTGRRGQKLRQPASFAFLFSFAAILVAIGLSSCAGYTTSASNSNGGGSNGNPSNAAVLSPSTTSLSFGTVSLGHTATQMLTIANVGTVTANLSPAITGAGFALVNGTSTISIPAGQSVQVQIDVTPQAAGPVTGTLSVSGDASNAPLTVSLSGMAAVAGVAVSPASLNFGNVNVGQNSTQNVTLTNTGNASAVVSAATVSGPGFGPSGLTVPATIGAGQSVSFSVEYAPTTAGAASGSIAITSSASATPVAIALTGTGTQAQLAATPASASFGSVTTGNTNTQSIQLMNAGNAALSFSQVTVSGAGFSVTGLSTSSTIPAGGSISFNAVFTPASAASTTGSIMLSTNGSPAQLTIPLSGAGTTATKVLSLSATNVAFGTVALGSDHTQNVTVTNTGNANVTIAGLSSSGTGFSASGVASGLILTPNQTATVSIAFAPGSTGSYSGTVSIASNATVSPNNIAVTGASHSVLLNWGASSSSGVTGYYVYRGTAAGQYAKVNSSTPVSASQLTYTDSSIQSGTYYYVVTSVDSSNVESAYSSTVTAVIP
jgi:Abnormal spindle-like microcephaly-assoc'd, ASPM-SPD-2-Hydin